MYYLRTILMMLFGPRPTLSRRRRTQTRAILCTIAIVYTIYFLFFSRPLGRTRQRISSAPRSFFRSKPKEEKLDAPEVMAVRRHKDMIMATKKGDDTAWLFDELSDWHKSNYVVDDPDAELTIPKNKGRESMVYLTCVFFFSFVQASFLSLSFSSC